MGQQITAAMWQQLRKRWAGQNVSLQGQVRQMMVGGILEGLLSADQAVPSSRELSEHLQVARNTVVLAYQQLVDEGYLVSRQRSGHYVNPSMVPSQLGQTPNTSVVIPPASGGRQPDWNRKFLIRASEQRSISKPADWQDYPYPFLYGQFDAKEFPTANWRECCRKALSVLDIREWAPDLITRDDDMLVEQIRTKVLPRRGVWAAAEEVVVTVGAQHALFLLADLLIDSNSVVGIEEPGYPDARNIFASRKPRIVPLEVDVQGLVVDDEMRLCDYIYTTPSHQCPTGVTMSLSRREELLHLAQDHDVILIEDDFEAENRFHGDPTPALKSLDKNDRVIYVGSLSKAIAPGLRMGYVAGPRELIAELRALRRLMVRHPSALIQRAFALFLSLGHHDAALRRLAHVQRERAGALIDALGRHLPQCRITPYGGGGACWLQLPSGVKSIDVADRARTHGVLVEPGDVFFQANPPPGQFLRLGYSSIPAAAIEHGVSLLAQTIRSLQR